MESRTRKVIALGFTALTLFALAMAVRLSLDPNNYFFYDSADRARWVYDPGSVALVCSVMLVESIVACGIMVLRAPRALWLRCIVGLALLTPWACFSTMDVVHMPAYFLLHHLWVWLLVLALFVGGLCSGIAQALAWFTTRGRLTIRSSGPL